MTNAKAENAKTASAKAAKLAKVADAKAAKPAKNLLEKLVFAILALFAFPAPAHAQVRSGSGCRICGQPDSFHGRSRPGRPRAHVGGDNRCGPVVPRSVRPARRGGRDRHGPGGTRRGELGCDDSTCAADDASVRLVPPNLLITHVAAGHGRGLAVDVGSTVVVDRWEFGAGMNGIGNRITWGGVTERPIAYGSVVNPIPAAVVGEAAAHPDVRIPLPVDVRGNVTYRADCWLAVGEVGHGVAGALALVGVERRVTTALDLRGGLSYSYGDWNPTGGLGIVLSRRAAIDFAAFGTTANFQRTRELALAASIRIST